MRLCRGTTSGDPGRPFDARARWIAASSQAFDEQNPSGHRPTLAGYDLRRRSTVIVSLVTARTAVAHLLLTTLIYDVALCMVKVLPTVTVTGDPVFGVTACGRQTGVLAVVPTPPPAHLVQVAWIVTIILAARHPGRCGAGRRTEKAHKNG